MEWIGGIIKYVLIFFFISLIASLRGRRLSKKVEKNQENMNMEDWDYREFKRSRASFMAMLFVFVLFGWMPTALIIALLGSNPIIIGLSVIITLLLMIWIGRVSFSRKVVVEGDKVSLHFQGEVESFFIDELVNIEVDMSSEKILFELEGDRHLDTTNELANMDMFVAYILNKLELKKQLA